MGQRLAGIFLLPITTRALEPSDYGVADLLEQIASVLTLLLCGNFSAGLGYFYFRAESEEERQRVIGTTIFGALLLGSAAAAVCFPFNGVISRLVFGNESASGYLRLVILVLAPGFLLEAVSAWLRVENRTVMFVFWSWLRVGIQVASVIVLVAYFHLRVWGLMSAAAITITGCAIMMTAYCLRVARPRFDWHLLSRMLRYGAPMGLAGLAMFCIHFGDRFILPHYRSLGELGIYALAYKIGMLVSLLYASFHTYWSAQVFQVVARDDARPVMARTFTYLMALLFFSGLSLILVARPVLRVLVAPAYQGAAALVPVIVVAYVLRSVAEFFRCLFLTCGRTGYDAICNIAGAVVCVSAYFLLIPPYGMWGAAYATLAAFVFLAAVAMIWTYRLSPYTVEGRRLLKLGAAAAVPLAAYALVPVQSLVLQFAWAALLIVTFPIALWLLRFPTDGEWSVAQGVLRSTAKKLASRA